MKKGFVKSRTVKSLAGVSLRVADEGQEVLVEGEVIWVKDAKILLARVQTETSTVDVIFFHPTAFHRRSFVRGASVRLSGTPTRRQGWPCLVHPKIIVR